MGIFSDYLEETREREIYELPDQTMFFSLKLSANYKRKKLEQDRNIKSAQILPANKNVQNQLRKSLYEMEELLCTYLCIEKIILEINRIISFQSYIVVDMMKTMLRDIDISKTEIGIQIQNIKNSILGKYYIESIPINEGCLKKDIEHIMMNSLVNEMRNGNQMDTAQFRKYIFDLAGIILFFHSDCQGSKKSIVSAYIRDYMKIERSYVKCENCGANLFHDIPYCLNCYERN